MSSVRVGPRERRLSPLTVVGVLLLGFGIASLGWVGWQYYGTNVTSSRAFDQERDGLRSAWATPIPAPTAGAGPRAQGRPDARPAVGDAVALLRIPQLGPDEYPVIAGVGEAELARGIGWYPGTAGPGDVGNFAVAGHRITHGEPFARLLELEAGDLVVVETRDAVYTYRLTTSPADLTVDDADTWVIDPVPGAPRGTPPRERLITLTTCTDLFASPKRSVAFGTLVEATRKP